jgi:tetratricopeptide (TPR) repeat protein
MSEYIDIEEKLEEFVAALESDVPRSGDVKPEYLDYLRKTFNKRQITLILGNLGVMKLDKHQPDAAEIIFRTAIGYDDDDPHLHFLLGRALCELGQLNDFKKAKKEFLKAKELLNKEEPSDYRKQDLAIIDSYLRCFDVSVFSAIGQMLCNLWEGLIVINQNGNMGIGVNYGPIRKGAKVAGVINEAERQNLTQVAQDIQKLLNQLSQSYPTGTDSEKEALAIQAIQDIKNNPTLLQKTMSALKAGGTAALGQALNHPAVSFVIAALDDLNKQKQ